MLHLQLVLLVWFLVLCPFQVAFGTLINVTIDDTNPGGSTITYLPSGAWNLGTDCDGCTAHPDPSKLFDGTWHDGTFNSILGSQEFFNQTLTASVTFNGTAVYVFCVLALTSTTSPDGNSDMTFIIDGEIVGTFVKAAPGIPGYDYNVSVFSTTSLLPGDHTLTIQNGRVGGNKSLVLLDSIVYSFDDGVSDSSSSLPSSPSSVSTSALSLATPSSQLDSPSSSGTSTSGIVAAAVVVPVVVVGLAIVAAIFYCRRRRRQQNIRDDRMNINPFNTPIGTARSQPVSVLNSSMSTAARARVHANEPALVSLTSTNTPSTSSSGVNGKSTPSRSVDGGIRHAQPLAVKGLVRRQNLSSDVSTPREPSPSSSSAGLGAGANDMYPDSEDPPPAYV